MTNQAKNNIRSNDALLQVKSRSVNHRALYFYQNNYLSAQLSEQGHRCVLWAKETPITQFGEEQTAKILKVDQASSVLGLPFDMAAYSPYGFLESKKNAALIAFNGQCLDLSSHAYVLGSGHRLFSPVRMRFNSPDSLSPFDRGGLSAYAYCENDPINFTDPSGHSKLIGGAQHALSSRYRLQNYIKDIHPTKLYREVSNLDSYAYELAQGIARDTKRLASHRKDLPKLEQAANKAKSENVHSVADPHEWADARRVKAMNNQLDRAAQEANAKLLGAQNFEKYLSENIAAKENRLLHTMDQFQNKLNEIRRFVSLGL